MLKKINIAIFIALIFMIQGCQKKDETKVDINGTPITIIKPVKSELEYTEKSLGQMDAKSAPQVSAEINGQVIKVLCEVGDKVNAGQVLAQIDISQYKNGEDIANANVKSMEAQVLNQKKSVTRYEELVKQNFVSEAKMDELKMQLKSYEEQLNSARASLKETQRSFGKATIKSPIDGVIYSRNISAGDFASPGKVMFGVVNSSTIVVKAPFPEGVGAKIKKDQKVYLYTSDSSQKIEGIVSDIRPFVSSNGRSFEAVVTIKNPGGWLIGGSVNVEVVTDSKKEAIMVPESAVVLRPAGDVVYIVNDGVAKQRKVVIGQKQKGFIEIKDGLSGGETIANDGAGLLSDGAKIIISTKK